MSIEKQIYETRLVSEIQSAKGAIRRQIWTNPALIDTNGVLDGQSLDGSTVTSFLNTLDFARNLTAVASGATAANIVVTGTNIRDEVITETITLNGAAPVAGAKCFKTITNIVVPTVAAEDLDVGWGDKLGLDRMMTGDEVLYATVDGVYEGTRPTSTGSITAIESNGADLNTALDGSQAIVVAYVSTELTADRNTTS